MEQEKARKDRKKMINYRIKQSQGFIKFHRGQIDELKRELDFINGHYDKTWEEEYKK